MDSSGPGAGGVPWRSDQPQWSQGRPHQPAAAAAQAAARLPPIGPTPLRRQNKRGLDHSGVTASVTRDDDCDMMEESESPEVRSFKRLKLEGGGCHAASSSSSGSGVSSLNGGAIEHNGLGYNNIEPSGLPGSDPAAAAFHRRHHGQQQMPAYMHGHGQNHGNGRPPMMPAGQDTADVRESHIHEFAPIRANPYQRQQQQYRHDHHHHHPLPPRPNAGNGPRCNSITSANSTDQSEQSFSHTGVTETSSVHSHGASYSGVNYMLGQLHAQRHNRQQQQSQQLQPHPPAPGHQRRNTLSPNWGISSNVAGGNGDGGTTAMSAGQHPGPLGGLRQMRPDGQQQEGGRPHPLGQGQSQGQSRQRVPSWRRKVQLPSSSNLY